jgi:glycerol-3-phosphate dehydrogenase
MTRLRGRWTGSALRHRGPAYEAACRAGAVTPILDAVHSILYQNKRTDEALMKLLSRDTRTEKD